MKLTSSEAAKLLKKLNDEYSSIKEKEKMTRIFTASFGEDVESIRPEYNYDKTKAFLDESERKIRTLKHALNVFNVTHTVPGFNMTLDEILIYSPQLTARKQKLAEMKSRLPKMRVEQFYSRTGYVIDYSYVNYDISAVESDYEKVADELTRAQLALDSVNSGETFDVEF